MKKSRYSVEEIVLNLRKIEIALQKGRTLQDACREFGIVEQSYYRWKEKYGTMSIGEAKNYHNLEKENLRLKKLVADLSIDNAILKEAISGKY